MSLLGATGPLLLLLLPLLGLLAGALGQLATSGRPSVGE